MGRSQEQTLRRCGENGLESALIFYNLLLTLSVPSQPFRPVPLAYVDKERPALVFDVCHKEEQISCPLWNSCSLVYEDLSLLIG